MTRIMYQWKLKPSPQKDIVERLSSRFNISAPLTEVLINRGYDSEDKIKKFITNEIIYLDNPFLFQDMESAVKIITKHINENNKILIWGDRDTDGVTSVVLLYKSLKNFGCEPLWYIPQSEGYGLNREVIDRYKDKVKLLITVDCGISAMEEIKYLKENGIDVVITDHHEPPEEIYVFRKTFNIPVINPYLEEYRGFRDLAGVGVVLKLVWALILSYDTSFINKDFVVVDIETTGLSPINNEICELAAVKIRNFLPMETFCSLVKTKLPITDDLVKIHGITNEMIQQAPSIEQVLPEFVNFIKDTSIIVHNAEFDISFINHNLKSIGLNELKNEIIDTLTLARQYFPLKSHSLNALCEEFMFEHKPLHRALNDVYSTIELLSYLYYLKNPRIRIFIENNLDLVSLGTISDIMPLIKDNRTIVKKGIETISSSQKPPFQILLNHFRKKISELDAEKISWYITPLLNSAGRMQKADIAVEFLLSENYENAMEWFQKLCEINIERRSLQETNITKFYELIEQQCDLVNDLILVVVAENVEHGVTGVVANHIMKEFNRPVILLIVEDDSATGAARSPKGMNIYSVLKSLEHLYKKFGGHEHACGLTMEKNKIDLFKQEIKILAKDFSIVSPSIEIDTELSPDFLNTKFVQEIELLEPCGAENPYPIFLLKNVKIESWKYFGSKKNFAKLNFVINGPENRNEQSIEVVCWDIPEIGDIVKNFLYFDIVGKLELDKQSKNGIKFVILDLQPVV